MLIGFRERKGERDRGDRGGGRERESEKHWHQWETSMWVRNINHLCALCTPTEDWICNLSAFPDQGLNPQPFGAGEMFQQLSPPAKAGMFRGTCRRVRTSKIGYKSVAVEQKLVWIHLRMMEVYDLALILSAKQTKPTISVLWNSTSGLQQSENCLCLRNW